MNALLAVLLLAALLRVWNLADLYVVQDEFFNIFAALRFADPVRFLELARESPLHPPLDLATGYLFGRFAGATAWLRLPSLIWGLTGVWAAAQLAGEDHDVRLPRWTSFLLAVSVLHVEWSGRVSYYAMLAALAALQTALLLRMLRRRSAWKGYCACAVVFMYAHLYAGMLACLHLLYIGVGPKVLHRRRSFYLCFLAWLAASACFLPWLAYSTSALFSGLRFDLTGVPWNPSVWRFLWEAPLSLSLGGDLTAHPVTWEDGLMACAASLYLFFYICSWAGIRRGGAGPVVRFAHFAVVCGIAVTVGLDVARGYFFSHRQLIWVLPFFLITISHGVCFCADGLRGRISQRSRQLFVVSVGAVILMMSLTRQGALAGEDQEARAGLTRVVTHVRAHARAADVLVFENAGLAQGFLFHFDRKAFLACTGFTWLPGGFQSYRTPDEWKAGPLGNTVLTGEGYDRSTKTAGAYWFFSGTLENLFVRPPIR